MKPRRIFLLLLIFLFPLALVIPQCVSSNSKEDPRGVMYAGASTCVKCHKDIYNSYIQTAHNQSVRSASSGNIQGSFAKAHHIFNFNNGLSVSMDHRDSGYYQSGYQNGRLLESHRFDLVFGLVKAETYLYWKGNQLYQLPISYFKALNSWTNSPGYSADEINFGRPVGKRCFECHSSYINELPPTNQSLMRKTVEFDKETTILNIDCERCHGPAINHVNFHTEYPHEKKARYITTYNTLTRAQRVDFCAVCHSGNSGTYLQSTFRFKPGDTLAKFKEPEFMHQNINASTMDVHGNQTQLLQASKCFIKSQMDCATCHNTHQNERDNLALLSQRCINCHQAPKHNTKNVLALGAAIKNNCIDCHMPLQPSGVIAVQTQLKKADEPYLVRNHRIAIYINSTAQKINTIK
jgi:hypothetical protein